jgi:hypothetical protein
VLEWNPPWAKWFKEGKLRDPSVTEAIEKKMKAGED